MALYQPFPMLAGRHAQAWRHQPAFRRPRHFHDEPELNIVLRGACTMGLGARSVTLGAGDVVFFQPGQDHALLADSADLELFVLALSPELAERAGVTSAKRTEVFNLDEQKRHALGEALAASGAISETNVVDTTLARLFRDLVQHFEPPHVVCRKVIASLREDKALNEEFVARRLRVHPSVVSRVFGQELGLNLVTYRARLRVIDFIRFVDDGRRLTDAALAAGFGSYSQCHRVFWQILGCSPRDYFKGRRAILNSEVAPEAIS